MTALGSGHDTRARDAFRLASSAVRAPRRHAPRINTPGALPQRLGPSSAMRASA